MVNPEDATVDFGSDYTVVCDDGYIISAESNMQCLASGSLNVTHTCDSKLIVLGLNKESLNVSLFSVKCNLTLW